MTVLPPLRERHLESGRGRVYYHDYCWRADYRTPNGTLVGAWIYCAAEAADWIRSKAKEATK